MSRLSAADLADLLDLHARVTNALPELIRGYQQYLTVQGHLSADKQQRRAELRVFLLRKGLSYRKVAKLLGISKTYVNQVFQHDRPAQHIRSRMVTELGIPPELVEYRPQESQAA